MANDEEILLFISHHSSTLDTALEVETALAKRGVSCWIAPRDVEPGEPFDNAVRAAIERSAAVLLLFCEKSDQSKHVKRELILGDSAGRPIIPLRLESVKPRELAYHLADSQWIDWIERREAVMDRVAAQARQYVNMPVAGGERPGNSVGTNAPIHPAPNGRAANRLLMGVAVAALLVAAIAVTWIVAGGGQNARSNDEPMAASSMDQQEETARSTDDEAEVANADPDIPAPAAPTPSPQLPETSPQPPQPATTGVRPSFDCGRASTTREFLICGSPRLAAQDRELAGLYRQARARARAARQMPRLRADQRAWLAQVQQCTDENCIELLQRERIAFFRQMTIR